MPKPMLRSTLLRVVPAALVSLALSIGAFAATPGAGDTLANDGNYAAAEAAFAQALKQSPRDVDTVNKLALINLQLGHAKQAVAYAHQAIALEPKQAKYQLLLGNALSYYVNDVGLFSKLGIAHQIEGAYQKAVQLEPTNADARTALAMYYLMAPGIAGGSDADAARQVEILAKYNYADVDYVQAQQAIRAKQPGAAEALLNKAVVASKDSSALVTLGKFQASHKQDEAALASFQRATREFPHAPAAYYQIGKLASEGKADAQVGITALTTYLGMPIDWTQQDAPYSWAHYRLGKIYARSGDAAKSRSEYEQALKLAPDFKESRQALAHPGAA